MKISKQNIIVVITGLLLLFATLYSIHLRHFYQSIHIVVDAKITTSDTYQLFYDTGKGFNEEESVKVQVFPSSNFQSVVFALPIVPISNFRFDPGSATKDVEIRQISFETSQQKISWGPEDILTKFSTYYELSAQQTKNNTIFVTVLGGDPQFVCTSTFLSTLNTHDYVKKTIYYVLTSLFFLVAFILILLLKIDFMDLFASAFNYMRKSKILTNGNFRFIFIFIILLFIPLSQMAFRYLPELKTGEKRTLAEAPQFDLLRTVATWDSYTKSLEAFFNDHYGLRTLLVHTNALLNVEYFKTSSASDVMLGKDGWFYYSTPKSGNEENFTDFYGKALFTADELLILKNNFLNLKNTLRKQNTDLIIVLAANKQDIYDEFLPDSIRSKEGTFTRADQLDELAKENNLTFIDTRQPLKDAKNKYTYPLYYKTDSHWNELGAFVAYKEIMKAVKADGYTVNDVYKNNDPAISSAKDPNDQDLIQLLGLSGTIFDNQYITVKKQIDYTSDDDHTSTKPIRTELNNGSYPRILVFRDSFSTTLIPYLSESFSKATYIWSPVIDYDLIKNEKPNIVIVEFVERFSNNLLQLGVE